MTPEQRFRRVAWWVVMGGMLLVALIVVLLREYNWLSASDVFDLEADATSDDGAAAPAGGPGLRVLATLPEFVLENERGDSFGLLDLRGRVWVADFIFTRCAGTCPMITERMADLAAAIDRDPSLAEIRLVSISVDPDFDRPEVLRDYARARRAEVPRWTFLTGTRAAVRGLVKDGFKLPVEDQNDPAMPILHSQAFVLVDRAGRLRTIADPLAEGGVDGVLRALAGLVAEPKGNDLAFPHDAADPRWYQHRERAQRLTERSIGVRHDFRFKDRLGASGIRFRHAASPDLTRFYRASHYDHGTGIAAADVDADGRPDLYFVNQAGRNALYRNLGGGRFEDVTDSASLTGTAGTGVGLGVGDRACVGAAFADVDNDGDPDLFVTAIRAGNLLFRNDGHGRFADVTQEAGVAGPGGHSSGAVFFDYDGDGRLDLFVTNVGVYTGDERREDGLWVSFPDAFAGHLHPDRSETSLLYRNRGDVRFEEASRSSGLVHAGWSGDATPYDDNGDGRPDLYVGSMQGHDELWRNVGGGRFERRGRQVFPATPWGTMGVVVLDWNGDGRFDLFATDMHTDMASDLRPENERRKHDWSTMYPPRFLGTDGNHILGNALFTNQGGDRFTEMSDAANAETGWPWGPSAGDLNADGWMDLFVAAGMSFPFRYRGNDLLLNDAGRRFANAEFLLGVEPRTRLLRPWFDLACDGADRSHPICKGEELTVMSLDGSSKVEGGPRTPLHGDVTLWASRSGRSAVLLDLDDDGDLDIVVNDYGDVPQILVSDLAQRGEVNFLRVRLKGARSNRDALGAVVTVRAGGRARHQVHDGKSGYLGQSALPLYFGLGTATQADSVSVRWPGGTTQSMRGPFRSGSTVSLEER
ncbi:MAG TPA: FG-GAP-like repeat-containing protein [Candidatus Polarisedimenticolia bacterium]|nr:FG-GAP-like repeat-containing protein [Candidatus Polarisedimenticolia bacterium]